MHYLPEITAVRAVNNQQAQQIANLQVELNNRAREAAALASDLARSRRSATRMRWVSVACALVSVAVLLWVLFVARL